MTVSGMTRPLPLAFVLLALAGCGGSASQRTEKTGTEAAAPAGRTATATLRPTSGSHVSGTVTFTEEEGGLRVFAMISGLTPGPHGFHIHENGDCSAPDGSSAGGHFNPTGMPHGGPDAAQHHAGDLGNIVADQGGIGHYEQIVHGITLDDGPTSIVGRAVVVHEGADDLTSQPSGNAGARVACGVIVAGSH